MVAADRDDQRGAADRVGRHLAAQVEDVLDRRRGDDVRGRALARRSGPPSSRSTWSAYRQAWFRSCSTITTVRPSLPVQVGDQVQHVDLVGQVEDRSSARRAAAPACPGPPPSRSRRAAAGRRTARPPGGRRGRSCSVAASAACTACSSAVDHCRHQVWCGDRPRLTRSMHGQPLRRDRRLRQDAEPLRQLPGRHATAPPGRPGAPRRRAGRAAGPAPAAASTSRRRWRRRWRVIRPGGTTRSRSGRPRPGRRRPAAVRRRADPGPRGSRSDVTFSLLSRRGWRGPAARAGTGAPSTPVTTPTGSSVPGISVRATRSRPSTTSAPVSRRGDRRRPGGAGEPLGDLRRGERHERDRPGRRGAERDQPDAGEQQAEADRLHRRAEPGGDVVAELRASASAGRAAAPSGTSTARAIASGAPGPSHGR